MNPPQHTPQDPPAPFDFHYAPGALEVRISELAIATADRRVQRSLDGAACGGFHTVRSPRELDPPQTAARGTGAA